MTGILFGAGLYSSAKKLPWRLTLKYKHFEDLPVWKAAIEFAVRVYALTSKEEFKGHGSLRDQLERAAVSISNNIAEGFERGTTQELLTFIYIARGSAGGIPAILFLLGKLPNFFDLKSYILNFKSFAENISTPLLSLAESFQKSQIKSQR